MGNRLPLEITIPRVLHPPVVSSVCRPLAGRSKLERGNRLVTMLCMARVVPPSPG
jgi:hypothetical protein